MNENDVRNALLEYIKRVSVSGTAEELAILPKMISLLKIRLTKAEKLYIFFSMLTSFVVGLILAIIYIIHF